MTDDAMADAGRVIAGTRPRDPPRRARGAGRGRSATGSSRRCSRSSSRTCRARVSSTCSPAAARPGIEALSRGAAHGDLRRARPGGGPGHRGEPRADAPRRTGRRGASGRTRSRWLRRAGPDRSRPFDVVVVDPPYAEPTLLDRGARGRSAPLVSRPAAGSWPSTSGATRRRRAVGLLASERERRFGETALTFYRRTRRSDEHVAVYPGSFDPITNGHLDIVAPGGDRLRPGHRRRPRQPAQGAAARRSRRGSRSSARRSPTAGAADRTRSRSTSFDGLTVELLPRARRAAHRPRPARDQRLRDRDAARPQQPGARAATSTRSSS